MVSPSSAWYPVLHTLADSVNPVLAILAIVTIIVEWRRSSPKSAMVFTIAVMLGLAAIYIIRALDHRLFIWRSFGARYSTHTAFATSVATSISFARPRYRVALVITLLAYVVLIVVMRFHAVADVITASVVAYAVTAPWHCAARKIRRDPSAHSAGAGPTDPPNFA